MHIKYVGLMENPRCKGVLLCSEVRQGGAQFQKRRGSVGPVYTPYAQLDRSDAPEVGGIMPEAGRKPLPIFFLF